MTAPRFARGTKSRIFLYLGITVIIFIAICAFHKTQSHMDNMKKTAEKCQQQQESLAAQLQVIFEYKLRLEKSVQQEKADHRHTKEELQTQLEEERARRSKEVMEATNKLASLQQHYKLLQGQHDDLTEECNKVRMSREKELDQLKTQVLQLRSENDRLLKQAKEAISEGQQAAALASTLKQQNQQLQLDLSKAKQQLATCTAYSGKASVAPIPVDGNLQSPPVTAARRSSSSPARLSAAVAAIPGAQQSVLNVPNMLLKLSSVTASAQSPSTNANNKAQRNKVNPMPAPGSEFDNVGVKPEIERANMIVHDEMPRLPVGVVPAPNVYHNDPIYEPGEVESQQGTHVQLGRLEPFHRSHDSIKQQNDLEESHQIAQPLPPGVGRMMPKQRGALYQGVQRRDAIENENVAQGKAVDGAPLEPGENKIWKVAGEEEEEGGDAPREGHAYRQYHPQENYKEEEGDLDERGAAHPAGGGPVGEHDHALGEPHEDLQLEDVDGDDDDVDQIDYGNEVLNNGMHRQKQAKKVPMVAKHDSVMVNPK